MLVELGNPAPHHNPGDVGFTALPGPAVTYVRIPDSYTCAPDADVRDLAVELARGAASGVTRLGDHEAFVAVAGPGGLWAQHGAAAPSWVYSDDAELERLVSEFFEIPAGRPDSLEDTHYTWHPEVGAVLPPGVIPTAIGPSATMTNAGRNLQMAQMFGGVGGAGTAGAAGTSTGTAATTMTDTGASWGTTQFVGLGVWCGNRYANIISHTATVLTLDQWYNPTAPGGAAGSTPAATTAYIIGAGAPFACFVGLTANAVAVAGTDTTLPAEITTASGGLVRKIAPLAHTAGATTMTLTPVFTANGSDTLPVTVAKIGISPSILAAVNNLFQSLLNATATLNLSGDQLTCTDTVTLGS